MAERLDTPEDRLGPEYRMPVSGHVLYVSDDREVTGIWAYALRQLGLEVTSATSSAGALAKWGQDAYDLTIIDVCGRGLDGIELARQVRAEAVNPIVLFTIHGEEAHILQAYQAGVDECVVKPVSPSLFLAKVRAWLRRTWTVPASALDRLQTGELLLDPASRAVIREGGATTRLTNLEFRLLHLLMSHPGQALPGDLIVDRVWGYSGGDSNLLKNLVYRVRRKVEPDPGNPRHILTGPAGGYTFSP